MVIGDGDIGRAIRGPTEQDAPLVVDPNGVEAGEIAPEGFEAVAGGRMLS